MKAILMCAALALATITPGYADELVTLANLPTRTPDIAMSPKPTGQLATMCFGQGEQISGMNKICYYNCLGSTVAINVKSYELCPLTINR